MSRSRLLTVVLTLLQQIHFASGQETITTVVQASSKSAIAIPHSPAYVLFNTTASAVPATTHTFVYPHPYANVSMTTPPPGASTPTVPLGMPRQCGLLDMSCPECDGAHVTDSEGQKYNISCDTYFMSQTGSSAKLQSVFKCMEACDNHARCVNAVWGPDKTCDLNYDPVAWKRVERKGYVGLQPVGSVKPAGTRSSKMVKSTKTKHTKSTKTKSPKPTKTAKAECDIDAITCPACNREQITDANGTSYRVLCGQQLYSETSYAVQRLLTPRGCLAECEEFPGCKGASWWPDGNCNLARGEDVFPQRAARHIAFQIFDPNYHPSPPSLSAFPTDTFTPITKVPSKATASPSCNPSTIHCPECDGLSLSDGFNETYRVQCNFQPICDDIIGRLGYTAQNDCMEHCDLDPTCFAAIYKNGHCDLCQGSLEGFMTYSSPDEYVVFVAEPLLNPATPSVTEGTAPNWTGQTLHSFSATSKSTRSRDSLTTVVRSTSTKSARLFDRVTSSTRSTTTPTSITRSSSDAITRTTTRTLASSPVPSGSIQFVSCPESNNKVAVDASDGTIYEVLCDVSLGGDGLQVVSASDLGDCAASCTESCQGFGFGSSTACTLLTSVTTVSAASGVTAAVVMSFR